MKQSLPRIARKTGVNPDSTTQYIYVSRLAKKAKEAAEELDLPNLIAMHIMDMDFEKAKKMNGYLINRQFHMVLRDFLKTPL